MVCPNCDSRAISTTSHNAWTPEEHIVQFHCRECGYGWSE